MVVEAIGNKSKLKTNLEKGKLFHDRPVLVDPKNFPFISRRAKAWLNADGTAKSVSEAEIGKTVCGPDDGDALG